MMSQDVTPAGDLTLMHPSQLSGDVGVEFGGEVENESGNVFFHQHKAHANTELEDSGNSRTSHAESNTASHKEVLTMQIYGAMTSKLLIVSIYRWLI